MKKATYKEIPTLIRNNIEFTGNSCKAVMNEGVYTVYSYDTKIFETGVGVKRYFDNFFYSATTSKIQNIIIRVFGLNGGRTKRSKKEENR